MQDVKSMMGHAKAVYGKWPAIRIQKHHPKNEADIDRFELISSMWFHGIVVEAKVTLRDIADHQQVKMGLSNLAAQLFRKCGEIALAAAAQTGGGHAGKD